MASQKQIEANRLNGMKGGPKTPEGKLRTRANSLRHGLCASTITVIQGEDAAEYEALRSTLVTTAEETASEPELVVLDQIAQFHWRTLRLRAQEKTMLEAQASRTIAKVEHEAGERPQNVIGATAIALVTTPEKEWNNYFRYEAAISRDLNRALDKLIRLQESRRRHERELLKMQLAQKDAAPAQQKPRAAAAGIGFVSQPAPGQTTVAAQVSENPSAHRVLPPSQPEIRFVSQPAGMPSPRGRDARCSEDSIEEPGA